MYSKFVKVFIVDKEGINKNNNTIHNGENKQLEETSPWVIMDFLGVIWWQM